MKTIRKVMFNSEELGYIIWSNEDNCMQYICKEDCIKKGIAIDNDIPVYKVQIKNYGTTLISWIALQDKNRGNQLLKEWHYEKNKVEGIDIWKICKCSNTKVNWICSRGHAWKALIRNRTAYNTDCPTCKKWNCTSKSEQYIYLWLKHNMKNVEYHYNIGSGLDVDIYIPDIKVAIEYDGEYYHRDGPDVEQSSLRYKRKLEICKGKGIELIHGIEQANILVEKLDKNEFKHDCCGVSWDKYIYDLIQDISAYIEEVRHVKISLETPDDIINTCIKNVSSTKPEKTLAYLKPDIAKEWHTKLNGVLTPEMVTPGSHERAYFVCSKCGHGLEGEWNVAIYNRGCGDKGCPACYRKKIQARRQLKIA